MISVAPTCVIVQYSVITFCPISDDQLPRKCRAAIDFIGSTAASVEATFVLKFGTCAASESSTLARGSDQREPFDHPMELCGSGGSRKVASICGVWRV